MITSVTPVALQAKNPRIRTHDPTQLRRQAAQIIRQAKKAINDNDTSSQLLIVDAAVPAFTRPQKKKPNAKRKGKEKEAADVGPSSSSRGGEVAQGKRKRVANATPESPPESPAHTRLRLSHSLAPPLHINPPHLHAHNVPDPHPHLHGYANSGSPGYHHYATAQPVRQPLPVDPHTSYTNPPPVLYRHYSGPSTVTDPYVAPAPPLDSQGPSHFIPYLSTAQSIPPLYSYYPSWNVPPSGCGMFYFREY
jgi:hypothetical protein